MGRTRRGTRDDERPLLVGRDLAHFGLRGRGSERERRRVLLAVVAGCLIAGLAIAALRVDLIRVRYGLADSLREEKQLLERQRELRAQVRALRDPARLRRLAARFELERPRRIVDLPVATGAPPDVSAGQP